MECAFFVDYSMAGPDWQTRHKCANCTGCTNSAALMAVVSYTASAGNWLSLSIWTEQGLSLQQLYAHLLQSVGRWRSQMTLCLTMPLLAGSTEQGRVELNDFSIPFCFLEERFRCVCFTLTPWGTSICASEEAWFLWLCLSWPSVSFLTFWAFWHAAVTAASPTLRKHHGLRAMCSGREKHGWQVAVPCSSGKGGGWGEICLLSASWEALERVAEGIRLCKQLTWIREEGLRARKARKGTSWLDHAGLKKTFFTKEILSPSCPQWHKTFYPVLFSMFFISREADHFLFYQGFWPTSAFMEWLCLLDLTKGHLHPTWF